MSNLTLRAETARSSNPAEEFYNALCELCSHHHGHIFNITPDEALVVGAGLRRLQKIRQQELATITSFGMDIEITTPSPAGELKTVRLTTSPVTESASRPIFALRQLARLAEQLTG